MLVPPRRIVAGSFGEASKLAEDGGSRWWWRGGHGPSAVIRQASGLMRPIARTATRSSRGGPAREPPAHVRWSRRWPSAREHFSWDPPASLGRIAA